MRIKSARIGILGLCLAIVLPACAPPDFRRSVQVEFYFHGNLVQRCDCSIGDRATLREIWDAPADCNMVPEARCAIAADLAEPDEATLQGIVEIRIREGKAPLGKATVACVHLRRDPRSGAWCVHKEEMAFIRHAAGL